MSFTGLLINDVQIYRASKVSDGQGGFNETWVLISTVKGRLRPANARETTIGERWDAIVSHVLYTLAGVDIVRNDRIIVTDKTLRIVAVREPSNYNRHLEIDCELLQVHSYAT